VSGANNQGVIDDDAGLAWSADDFGHHIGARPAGVL
jgi:hypothetical protein